MARDAYDRVYTWGLNNHGQLGDGTTTNRATPGLVPGLLLGPIDITAGNAFVFARNSNTVWGWGRNSQGQLGDGTIVNRLSPIFIDTNLYSESCMTAGNAHALFCGWDGFGPPPPGPQWVSAGRNDHGQLARSVPSLATTFDYLMSGGNFVLADDGDAGTNMTLLSRIVWDIELSDYRRVIQAAGSNIHGELGNGSWTSSTVLTNVCLP